MAARTGARLKGIKVKGIDIIACPECKGKTVNFSWAGCFHDDSIECENGHISFHTFKKGDKLLLTSGIIYEFDGEEFEPLKTRANYKKRAELILKEAKQFPED